MDQSQPCTPEEYKAYILRIQALADVPNRRKKMATEKHGCSVIGSSDMANGECCREHDREYAKGELGAKFAADFALFWCLITSPAEGHNVVTSSLLYSARFIFALVVLAFVLTVGSIWWLKYVARRVSGGTWFPKSPDEE